MALARIGRAEEAREASRNLQATAAPPAPGDDRHIPTLLAHAFLERFEPDRAQRRRTRMFDASRPDRWPALVFAARMGLALDVPAAQLALGTVLVSAPEAPASVRANGHLARALALMVLGRPAAALPRFDSAADLLGTRAAAVDAAEWRVVLPAMGLPGVPADERERGREQLRGLAGATPHGLRAAWALAVDRYAGGDLRGGDRWLDRLEAPGADTLSVRLRRLAESVRSLSLGRPGDALALSEPLLDSQFLPRGGDPFSRAVLHLLRARAFRELGDDAAAWRELVWSENQDIARLLEGPIQAAEVDWAAGVHADLERARISFAIGEEAAGCRVLKRVIRLWEGAEAEMAAGRSAAIDLHQERCP